MMNNITMDGLMTTWRLWISCCLIILGGWTGCTMVSPPDGSGFTYQAIPVATGTVPTGDGSSVTFRGKAIALSGTGIQAGERLRPAIVTRPDLSLMDLTETSGTIRIISVVPSLDTRVCEQQTHYLSEKNQGLDNLVSLYTVSVDTPFAQARFAREAGIRNVSFFSDYRGARFGRAHGLFIEDLHILARAIMVVDQYNVVRYLQVTPDLASMPDMEAAFKAARALISQESATSRIASNFPPGDAPSRNPAERLFTP
ncbi:MAG: thiol peroxidase [Nitrospirae bacterium]|nr:MAG: thiol peroxidase [Nitrospirota bacterium]